MSLNKFSELFVDLDSINSTNNKIEVLKKMGRPIVEVKEMKNEESVVCSLTGSPSDFNMDY